MGPCTNTLGWGRQRENQAKGQQAGRDKSGTVRIPTPSGRIFLSDDFHGCNFQGPLFVRWDEV